MDSINGNALDQEGAGLLEEAAADDFTAIANPFNKWFTVWRHCHGYLSFKGCEAAFRAHPEWRAA